MIKTLKQKNAAVILLHEISTDSLILTQRSDHLKNHPGEICFPGGRWQRDDQSFYKTALREVNEELGIEASRITLLKAMKPERTLTGYIIYPWLASIISLKPYFIDNNEVADVFKLPMLAVTQETNYQEIGVERFGIKIKSIQYKASPYFIWGATARIMMQLTER